MRPPEREQQLSILRANVTTFRSGKVVEIVSHESPEAALAAVKRRN